MARREQEIAAALNTARNSNILTVVGEQQLSALIEDYLLISDEEENYSDDDDTVWGPTASRSPTTSAAAQDLAAEDTTTDEEDVDDSDLVEVDSASTAQIPIVGIDQNELELTKIRTFKCGCSQKNPDGTTGCMKQFTEDFILNKRIELSELSNDEKDFFIFGLLSAQKKNVEEMTAHKRASRRRERKLPRRTYSLEGHVVCREAFRFILCLGQTRLVALQKSAGIKPRVKASHGGRQYNTKALSTSDIFRVVRFIESFTEVHGLCLPGRIPGYKRCDLKLLPSYYTKVRLWRTYKANAADLDHRIVGHSSFVKLWKTYLPHIVVARPMTDLCNVCQTNNTLILRGANTSDPNKVALLDAQKHHLHLVSLEREYYNSVVRASKETAQRERITGLAQTPPNSREMSMGYCFDFAQQVHLPSSPMQPGPIYFLTPRKCGIFGVCCPAIPQQVNFLIDESMSCGKGSNAVISYLHFFFEKYGLGETEAILHCDNCSGQNKNKYILWYLMWRVLHGCHTKISLNFMVPGHTKFAPDWCFGLLKQNFRRMEVHCLDDMSRAVTESAVSLNKAQLVGLEDGNTVFVPSYDWQAFFTPYFKAFVGIKSLFHFRFEQGSLSVFARSSLGEEISFELLNDSNLPPAELPDPIPPPGLSSERRKYLYEKIRPFVKDDCKDILCPE